VPWREVNRYQRNDGAIVQTFDDARPSLPVPFASSKWGSLASFGARAYPGDETPVRHLGQQLRRRGRIHPERPAGARGQHRRRKRDLASPHFADQSRLYADGELRPVHFDPADVQAHAVRRYRPGE
jgi:acyl-homoserine-lactone acylase